MAPLEQLGIECLELDVTKSESIRSIRDKVSEITGGSLDILVNNAYVLSFLIGLSWISHELFIEGAVRV